MVSSRYAKIMQIHVLIDVVVNAKWAASRTSKRRFDQKKESKYIKLQSNSMHP
ncbi:uncharacterized protein PHALS_01905 [Plasmopara halstedii]|uniref:Uncharacterized protein n=1 Tax=Plasmopara halstedii TaxID=4781 RepID=A0A0P1AY36_PLAHL|nr:uncharacterized protein PHALS_01905 [Plasmopara halstedii]CEG45620.1 hypothetical protein PHALS_01905 [Plasmopara halstedii]|eukprot:XP_024581989.1 hypothetical protein PHALS_01905 [Plasmopara halstedii]